MTEKPLKTKHLILTPMTDEALSRLAETAEEEREAYGQMLALCREHPEDRLWYAPWQISLKSSPETPVGALGFKGPQQKGRVELGYGVDLPYRCRGYATEAAGALIEWAFAQKDVYIVEAEAAPDNAASLRVLEKAGFIPMGVRGEEGPRFVWRGRKENRDGV